MKEYDIYLPLTYNDGSPVERNKLVRVREQLLKRFDGVTYFPQKNQGFWVTGNVTYRDEIVIFRVLTDEVPRARKFMRRLKEDLKDQFDQEEILIVEKAVKVI